MRRIDPHHVPSCLAGCPVGLTVALLLFLSACQPKEVQTLVGPSQALGAVLADEAIRVVGPRKQVALITHDTSWGQPSSAEQAFRAAMKKHGITIEPVKAVNPGNPMLSGEVGVKSADFLDALDKARGSGAIVSLVGAPALTEADMARVIQGHPPVFVVATASLGDKMGVHTDPVQLARLLEANVIQLAIIDGAEPAASSVGKSDPNREIFAQHYRILRRPE